MHQAVIERAFVRGAVSPLQGADPVKRSVLHLAFVNGAVGEGGFAVNRFYFFGFGLFGRRIGLGGFGHGNVHRGGHPEKH
jgi:hypothetical protein